MRIAFPLVCAAVSVFLIGCASTNYSAFEGGGVMEGRGGTKKVVEGVDIWTNGSPPRKYKVIGVIDDSRRKTVFGVPGYEKGLAKKAREAGGDAIVIMDSHDDIIGYHRSGESGSATSTGTISGNHYQGQTVYQGNGSTVTPMRDQITKAAVIKYQD